MTTDSAATLGHECRHAAVETSSDRGLVSIVIPTYNRGSLLKKAILSALAQEKAGELFDLEIIVVDDCSPDQTAEVVAEFPAVRYIRLPENRGASGARNAGIRCAQGKYVALLDDDDEFLTHKLMVQVPILEAHHEVGVLYGQSVVTGSDVPLLIWPDSAPSGQVFEDFLTRTDDFLHPPTWLVRRELFEAAGWFDESHRTMEHYDLALRLAALTPWLFLSGGPVARGRFSKMGKWYSNIINGTNEQRLPLIVERALARLPSTPEAERLRYKARAAVCATIAEQRWWKDGVVSAQQYLLSALDSAPWLLTEPVVVDWLKRVAGALAVASHRPELTVKSFWHELEQQKGIQRTIASAQRRRLLGELLGAAAIALQPGSPRRARIVAVNALLHAPIFWAHPGRLARLFRKTQPRPESLPHASSPPAT